MKSLCSKVKGTRLPSLSASHNNYAHASGPINIDSVVLVGIATKLEEEKKTQGSCQEMSYPLLVKCEEMSCFGNRTCKN